MVSLVLWSYPYIHLFHVLSTPLSTRRLLDWRERRSGATQPKTKYDKVVIFRHAFHPKEFEVSLSDYC